MYRNPWLTFKKTDSICELSDFNWPGTLVFFEAPLVTPMCSQPLVLTVRTPPAVSAAESPWGLVATHTAGHPQQWHHSWTSLWAGAWQLVFLISLLLRLFWKPVWAHYTCVYHDKPFAVLLHLKDIIMFMLFKNICSNIEARFNRSGAQEVSARRKK